MNTFGSMLVGKWVTTVSCRYCPGTCEYHRGVIGADTNGTGKVNEQISQMMVIRKKDIFQELLAFFTLGYRFCETFCHTELFEYTNSAQQYKLNNGKIPILLAAMTTLTFASNSRVCTGIT